MNSTILVGNLTADPKLHISDNGKKRATFSMAINEGQGENEKTHFVNLTAFDTLAENIVESFSKGMRVIVAARLNTYKQAVVINGEERQLTMVAYVASHAGPELGEQPLVDDGLLLLQGQPGETVVTAGLGRALEHCAAVLLEPLVVPGDAGGGSLLAPRDDGHLASSLSLAVRCCGAPCTSLNRARPLGAARSASPVPVRLAQVEQTPLVEPGCEARRHYEGRGRRLQDRRTGDGVSRP